MTNTNNKIGYPCKNCGHWLDAYNIPINGDNPTDSFKCPNCNFTISRKLRNVLEIIQNYYLNMLTIFCIILFIHTLFNSIVWELFFIGLIGLLGAFKIDNYINHKDGLS